MKNQSKTNESSNIIHYSLLNQELIPKKTVIWSIKYGQN